MDPQDATRTTPTIGAVVVGPDGRSIGEVVGVAVDADTVQPSWLVVSRADGSRTALPSYIASLTARGELAVPFGGDLVQSAPACGSDVLDEAAALAVLTHYGLPA